MKAASNFAKQVKIKKLGLASLTLVSSILICTSLYSSSASADSSHVVVKQSYNPNYEFQSYQVKHKKNKKRNKYVSDDSDSSDSSDSSISVSACKGAADCDDATNIENALNSVAAGGTVKLGRGTFMIKRPIVAENFHGTIIGKGQSRTTLEAVGSLEAPFPSVATLPSPAGEPRTTAIFVFKDPTDKLIMQKMTLQLPENFGSAADVFSGLMYAFVDVRFKDNSADTNFNHLTLNGSPLPLFFADFHPWAGVVVFGDNDSQRNALETTGDHKFHNNTLNGTTLYGYHYLDHKDSTFDIYDNDIQNFKQLKIAVIANSTINIHNNNITQSDPGIAPAAVNINQESGSFSVKGKTNKVNIKDNIITANSSFAGLEISSTADPTDPTLADFDIDVRKNHIILKESDFFGPGSFPLIGILLLEGHKNARFECNTITGDAGEARFKIQGVKNSLFLNNVLSGPSNSVLSTDYLLVDLPEGSCLDNTLVGVGDPSIIDECIGTMISTVSSVEDDCDSDSSDSSDDSSS